MLHCFGSFVVFCHFDIIDLDTLPLPPSPGVVVERLWGCRPFWLHSIAIVSLAPSLSSLSPLPSIEVALAAVASYRGVVC
jgi:hypothetical protein